MVVGGAVAVEDGGYVAMVVECGGAVRGKKNHLRSHKVCSLILREALEADKCVRGSLFVPRRKFSLASERGFLIFVHTVHKVTVEQS